MKTKPFLVLLLFFLVLGGGAAATASEDQSKRWSVLLITVDCLRPDHMSLYGYDRETTPHLAKLAEESMVFDNAFATSGWTSPGVVSLLTGYYPPVHGQNGRHSFYDETLASPLRVLAEEGYDVFGSSISGPTLEGLGWQRERSDLRYLIKSRIRDETPFFSWVHIRDTHLPYRPTEANAARWAEITQMTPGIEAVQKYGVIFRPRDVEVSFSHAGNVEFQDQDIPIVRALYDGEVADVDERLGLVLQQMTETGLLDRTIVIISADHGEELFEHGWVGHASTSYDGKLYDEVIRIPLIIRLPDKSRVGRFDSLVQGVDVMPTLFELLGIPLDRMDPPMQGNSLLALAGDGEGEARRFAFSETTIKGWTTPIDEMRKRVVSVRTQTRKLIWFPETDGYRIEGYDLEQDPGEQSNIYEARKAEFAELERAREAWSRENRDLAAALVISGAKRRMSQMSEALHEADIIEAVRDWEAIAMLQRTWDLETDPFFAEAPHRPDWRRIRRDASRLIAKALECDGKGGTLRLVEPEGGHAAENWRCDG